LQPAVRKSRSVFNSAGGSLDWGEREADRHKGRAKQYANDNDASVGLPVTGVQRSSHWRSLAPKASQAETRFGF
jgi:hypothetical protein